MPDTAPDRRPHWAVEFGEDGFGWFAAFEVHGQRQRLRWIPPGQFEMGSPADEPGRTEFEGPQRVVQLTRGFWLGEVPVTQALWTAVTGRDPARFRDPLRPAEQLSWREATRFIWEIEELTEDDWWLPTEAQWEYACRAGTRGPVWTGATTLVGANHAPELDAIAWYAGNAGVDYDLEAHVASAAWPQTQFPHTRAGTRRVGQKAPNPFGLYDMLGNVWEWCADWWADDYTGAPTENPRGPREGTERVSRGGSFLSPPGAVRAASRGWFDPEACAAYIGVRIASA